MIRLNRYAEEEKDNEKCSMGRVQEELSDNGVWKELLKREPVIKETVGAMPGSRAKEGENRQVVFRIGGSEHIQVMAEVIAFPMGIPADVTDRGAVTGKGKIHEVNKSFINGTVKKKGTEYPIKEPAGYHVIRGCLKRAKRSFTVSFSIGGASDPSGQVF